MARIFVYGTLKRGQSNFPVMQRAQGHYLGEGQVEGQLLSFVIYPGLVPGTQVVAGEVFEVPDEGLPILDELEGFSPTDPEHSQYIRRMTPLLPGGAAGHADVYWMHRHPTAGSYAIAEWPERRRF